MKLTYMAQGWMLGLAGRPLFSDRIEAWKYGPVIPALYHKTKEFGSSVITQQLPAPTGEFIDAATDGLLDSVVENYGRLSGIVLSNLTHRPESPWSKVWREGVTHAEIPTEIIRAHYTILKDSPTVFAA